MYLVRLNNVKIFINGKKVCVEDKFGDISDPEVSKMVDYLIAEGFLPSKGNIDVLISKEKCEYRDGTTKKHTKEKS